MSFMVVRDRAGPTGKNVPCMCPKNWRRYADGSGGRQAKAPETGQRDLPDGGETKGLILRVSRGGTRTFYFRYRRPIGRKQTKIVLGEYPALSLANARERTRAYRQLVKDGTDPRDFAKAEAERRAQEAEERRRAEAEASDNTFAKTVEDYVTIFQVAKKDNRTWKETRRTLLVNCAEWRDRPVTSISRCDVHDLLDAIMAEGKGYSANRTYAALRTFFRWCARRDKVATDPMTGVERPFDGETARDRVWNDDEIAAIWRASDALGGNAGPALKLLILLGQRRDEVFHMSWDEIEADGTLWRLATRRSKAKREHVFPLPVLAQRIIKAQPRTGSYVFPTSNGKPILNWSAIKDRTRKGSGVEDFTFHCARHTLRTALDRLGCPPHVKDECLNHARQGVGARHYSHYTYEAEQRQAFEAWARHVETLVYGENVVALRINQP